MQEVLEAAKLAYVDKTQESIISQKLGSGDFGESLKVFSTKVNLLSENISKSCNLDDSGVSLPIFPSRTNLKLHNISVTPKMV